MKNWAILLLFLNGSLLIAMEPSDDSNNNNKKLAVRFKPCDVDELVAIRTSLLSEPFLSKHNINEPVDFPFLLQTFVDLNDLLEMPSTLQKIVKTKMELHTQLYTLVTSRYPAKKKYRSKKEEESINQLIEAGLFLGVGQSILEACIRSYVEKKAQGKKKRKDESFPQDINYLLHKWYFLCVNSQYILKEDDFSVSWQEIEYFLYPYLEQKFYRRAPLLSNSISNNISLAGFHLDSTISLKEALEKRRVIWENVQRLELECNKLQEVSFLEEIKANVKVILLNRNLFTTLNLRNFAHLTELNVSNNQLTSIPFLACCSALEILWLSNNKIKQIDEFDLLDLSNLKELQLSDNKIAAIHPRALVGCLSLKLFDLSRNPITKLEFDLPSECAFCIDKK